ncbi:hypothetical protein M9H77_13963 [Catharanthus roseus]|uniref:Uncharacterized protein n=1 Tax=Catharanthus roseus TaxID=4058 RepID=A0ACC0BLZ4_CATRO|nr:hypothetical protein M9H77_13963 [Catharanthus roseus]
MAGTLVHDSVSKCEGASSHSVSTKVFLKTYILLERVGGNTLPKTELSQNPVRHVGLHIVKICNEPVPCGSPTITNILSPLRYPPNLISYHHIQSQANIQ